MKTQVLVLLSHYLPGVKAGGPIRSIANLVDILADEINFRIVTSDRDLNDTTPYADIQADTWLNAGGGRVKYLSASCRRLRPFQQLLAKEKAEYLYLNSFFARRFSMLPVLLHWCGACAQRLVLLAPRGEFSRGALAIKAFRKMTYVRAVRCLGLYRGIIWHASSELEAQDIRRLFGSNVNVRLALPQSAPSASANGASLAGSQTPKEAGSLRIMFLSRITRKKNLLGALSLLQGLSGKIEFNIYGPIEDHSYWAECELAIRELPSNVSVVFHSTVAHSRVSTIVSEHHLFLFPTLGENYGHVIYEALSNGCPVLISDQTPWRGLERLGAGWDLPLDRPELFRAALETCLAMEQQVFHVASSRSKAFAREFTAGERDPRSACRALFDRHPSADTVRTGK